MEIHNGDQLKMWRGQAHQPRSRIFSSAIGVKRRRRAVKDKVSGDCLLWKMAKYTLLVVVLRLVASTEQRSSNFILASAHSVHPPLTVANTTASSSSSEPHRRRLQENTDPNSLSTSIFGKDKIPLEQRGSRLRSSVHCVGENFSPDYAWMYRSCHFRNLCWDTQQHDFVVFQSTQEAKLQQMLEERNSRVRDAFAVTVSSLLSPNASSMSLGSLGPSVDWDDAARNRLRWFPRVVPAQSMDPKGVYMLPENTVLAPFLPVNATDPAHVIWHNLMPILNQLQIFGLADANDILPMQFILPDGDPLPGTCDSSPSNQDACQAMLEKVSPLLLGPGRHIPTTQDLAQDITKMTTSVQDYSMLWICAPHAVAGMGMLSDDGAQSEKWRRLPEITPRPRQEQYTHNHALGARLIDFSQHIHRKLGIEKSPRKQLQITVALTTGKTELESRVQQLAKEFSTRRSPVQQEYQVTVESHVMDNAALEEQARLAEKTTLFVSVCGAGIVAATALSPGSCLVAISCKEQDMRYPWYWDLFVEHAAYLRARWLTEEQVLKEQFFGVLQGELDWILEDGLWG